MEKHHKLRRDPSWSPHGCNICGKEGHQAASCPNGTVNWKQRFGEEAFIVKDRAGRMPWERAISMDYAKVEPDYEALAKQARAYAAAKRAAEEIDHDALKSQAQEIEKAEGAHQEKKAKQAEDDAAAADAAAAAAAAPEPAEGEGGEGDGDKAGGTGGWTKYLDGQGRPYYVNQTTNVTQWECPSDFRE